MITSPVKSGFKVTQWFGGNKAWYAPFGLKGHNGQDLATPTGIEVVSPLDKAKVRIKHSGDKGYGLHVRLIEEYGGSRREVVLAHLSEVSVETGDVVKSGQSVGKTGNTGFSTGSHLHWGLRRRDKNGRVLNYDNGYLGWLDIFGKGWINVYKPSEY